MSSAEHANDLLEGMLSGMVGDQAANAIRGAFRAMEIAEDEIKRAYPRREDEPPEIFLQMLPPPCLRGRPEWLLRAHYRELASRRGTPLSNGTLAETVVAFHMASLKAPMRSDYALAYVWASHQLLDYLDPDEIPEILRHFISREDALRTWGAPSTPDAIEERIDEARKGVSKIRAAAVREARL